MIYLVLAILFLLLQGFFAGMETGMVSLMKPRVEHAARTDKTRINQMLLFFESHSGIMISTTLVAVNLCVVGSSLMTKKFMETCGFDGGISILVSTAVLSVLLLTVEIIPKDWFRQSPFTRCAIGVPVLYVVYIVLFVPIRIFAAFTGFLNRVFSPAKQEGGQHEDFRLFIKESENGGVVDAETADILENGMQIPETRIGDLATPRNQVLEIPHYMTIREAFDFAKK